MPRFGVVSQMVFNCFPDRKGDHFLQISISIFEKVLRSKTTTRTQKSRRKMSPRLRLLQSGIGEWKYFILLPVPSLTTSATVSKDDSILNHFIQLEN